MQEVVQSFRKLGMPRDLAMILTIMVRFLFIFVDELRDIRQSMRSRNFDPYNKAIPYKWRVKQVGYSIAMMFLKAYEKGDSVIVSVKDTGLGIKQSDLAKVKTKFYKANHTRRGSGIGLAVADEIISMHGGELDIDSEGEGKGTTVTITLPAVKQ